MGDSRTDMTVRGTKRRVRVELPSLKRRTQEVCGESDKNCNSGH